MSTDDYKALQAFLQLFDDTALHSPGDKALRVLVTERLAAGNSGVQHPLDAMKSQAGDAIKDAISEDYARCRRQLDELQKACVQLIQQSKQVAANVTMLDDTGLDALRTVLVRQGVEVKTSVA